MDSVNASRWGRPIVRQQRAFLMDEPGERLADDRRGDAGQPFAPEVATLHTKCHWANRKISIAGTT